MKLSSITSLALLALSSPNCAAISIATDLDANHIAAAIFNGAGVIIDSTSFAGSYNATGSFTNGPFGIGAGGILTTGSAMGAVVGGNVEVQNHQPGSTTYCGPNTYDGSVLTAHITIQAGYAGLLVNFILASQGTSSNGGDPIGIFLDGTQYARAPSGSQFNAGNQYLRDPIAIHTPDSDTSYSVSSPPMALAIPAAPGAHTVVIAVCDLNNDLDDSGLLINAGGCVNCPQSIYINYVTTTTTLGPGTATYTQTIKALHTTSGTFIVGVQASTTSTSSTLTSSTTSDTSTTSTTSSDSSTSTDTSTTSCTSSTSTDTSTTSSDTSATSSNTSTTSGDSSTTSSDSSTSSETSTTSNDPSTTSNTPTTSSDPSTTSSDSPTSSGSSTTSTTDVNVLAIPTDPATTTTSTTDSSSGASPASTTSDILTSVSQSQTGSQMGATTGSQTGATAESQSATQTDSSAETDPTSTTAVSDATVGTSTSGTADAPDTTGTSADSFTSASGNSGAETASNSSPVSSHPPATSNSATTTGPQAQTLASSSETASLVTTASSTSGSDGSPTATSSSSANPTASNMATMGLYAYTGCLGSPGGYPSFTELTSATGMTTEECLTAANGSQFVGIFNNSCFAADNLRSSNYMPDEMCDLPCPGNAELFCGGFVSPQVPGGTRRRSGTSLGRRAAPADVYLTIYVFDAADSSGASSGIASASVSPTSGTQYTTAPSAQSASAPLSSPPISDNAVDSVVPAGANTLAQTTEFSTTIVTVLYTTVCPTDGAILVTTEACVTLSYHPCEPCEDHGIPSVEMTTITEACAGCGYNGQDEVTLTVPRAAVASAATLTGAGQGYFAGSQPAAGQAAQAGATLQPNPASPAAETTLAPGALPAAAGSALPSGVLSAAAGETLAQVVHSAAAETTLAVSLFNPAATKQQTGLTNTTPSAVVTAKGSRNSVCWLILATVVGVMLLA